MANEIIKDLKTRVMQFKTLELPGQPMASHMGTVYLVDDLWREVQCLRRIIAAAEIADLPPLSGRKKSTA